MQRYLKVIDPMLKIKKLIVYPGQTLINELKDFHSDQVVRNIQVGVLYCREGQCLEEEMFGNGTPIQYVLTLEHPSPACTRFLDTIGTKIKLKGFEGYSGGLDVRGIFYIPINFLEDMNGTESYYTSWRDFNIMYHFSCFLPFNAYAPQQVDRKRFLGNDIVVIIFKEGNTPYNPKTISSQFNRIKYTYGLTNRYIYNCATRLYKRKV